MLFLASAAADLSAFKPFVGACWRTDFSPSVHDVHCYESLYGGVHVRDRHEVQQDGKTIYAGERIYSVDGTALVFTYVNSLGGVGHGTARAEAGKLRFVGRMRASPKDVPQPIDSEWRVIDADHYETRSLVPSRKGQPDRPHLFTRVTGDPPK